MHKRAIEEVEQSTVMKGVSDIDGSGGDATVTYVRIHIYIIYLLRNDWGFPMLT